MSVLHCFLSILLYFGCLQLTHEQFIVNFLVRSWYLAYRLVIRNFMKKIVLKQLKLLVNLNIYIYIFETNRMKIEILLFLGYVCCTITVLFFAAPCCMLMEVFRKKSTEMLPMPLILMSFLVSIQWFVFGMIAKDLFLQIPNFLGAILSGTQLILFCIYPNKPRGPNVSSDEVPYAIF